MIFKEAWNAIGSDIKIHKVAKELRKIDELAYPREQHMPTVGIEYFLRRPGCITEYLEVGGEKAGYISGFPLTSLKSGPSDPGLVLEEGALYIWSFAVVGGKPRDVRGMCNSFMAQAKEQGYQKITMHTRQIDGLSKVLERRYGAKKMREIENYGNSGETFSYLELMIK